MHPWCDCEICRGSWRHMAKLVAWSTWRMIELTGVARDEDGLLWWTFDPEDPEGRGGYEP